MTDKPQAPVEDAALVQGPEAPGLELQDIALVVHLVNIAIKRGAYERAELRGVLDVTDKIDSFLQYTAQAQEAAKASQQGET